MELCLRNCSCCGCEVEYFSTHGSRHNLQRAKNAAQAYDLQIISEFQANGLDQVQKKAMVYIFEHAGWSTNFGSIRTTKKAQRAEVICELLKKCIGFAKMCLIKLKINQTVLPEPQNLGWEECGESSSTSFWSKEGKRAFVKFEGLGLKERSFIIVRVWQF